MVTRNMAKKNKGKPVEQYQIVADEYDHLFTKGHAMTTRLQAS